MDVILFNVYGGKKFAAQIKITIKVDHQHFSNVFFLPCLDKYFCLFQRICVAAFSSCNQWIDMYTFQPVLFFSISETLFLNPTYCIAGLKDFQFRQLRATLTRSLVKKQFILNGSEILIYLLSWWSPQTGLCGCKNWDRSKGKTHNHYLKKPRSTPQFLHIWSLSSRIDFFKVGLVFGFFTLSSPLTIFFIKLA